MITGAKTAQPWKDWEGQIIDGRYRIVKIGEESLIIEYANGTGRTNLPLR